jgi:hypothetical protein
VRNWFNQVDSTYRGDLRELNELNFARFDAKLEQRMAEVKADVRQEIAALRTELREGMAGLRGEFRAQLGEWRGEFRGQLAELSGEFRAQLKAEGNRLMAWMVGLWITAGAALYFFPLGRP